MKMSTWAAPARATLERDAVVFVENALYFCALERPPPPSAPIQRQRAHGSSALPGPAPRETLFMRSDKRADGRYHYQPFFSDFGPPDLGAIFRFCDEIDALLAEGARLGQRVVHVVRNTPHARSNGALLTAAYALLRLRRSPGQAFAPLLGVYPPLAPVRDASYGLCTHTISVLDCLRAIHRACNENILAAAQIRCRFIRALCACRERRLAGLSLTNCSHSRARTTIVAPACRVTRAR